MGNSAVPFISKADWPSSLDCGWRIQFYVGEAVQINVQDSTAPSSDSWNWGLQVYGAQEGPGMGCCAATCYKA